LTTTPILNTILGALITHTGCVVSPFTAFPCKVVPHSDCNDGDENVTETREETPLQEVRSEDARCLVDTCGVRVRVRVRVRVKVRVRVRVRVGAEVKARVTFSWVRDEREIRSDDEMQSQATETDEEILNGRDQARRRHSFLVFLPGTVLEVGADLECRSGHVTREAIDEAEPFKDGRHLVDGEFGACELEGGLTTKGGGSLLRVAFSCFEGSVGLLESGVE